jgi:hypothetical protein
MPGGTCRAVSLPVSRQSQSALRRILIGRLGRGRDDGSHVESPRTAFIRELSFAGWPAVKVAKWQDRGAGPLALL